jgi:hypothetical protein
MTVTLTLTPETEQRLRERAARNGLTLEAYLQQLAERDAFGVNGGQPSGPSPVAPTFEEMTGPFARAVEAAGLSEEEVGELFERVVKQVRAERRTKADHSG